MVSEVTRLTKGIAALHRRAEETEGDVESLFLYLKAMGSPLAQLAPLHRLHYTSASGVLLHGAAIDCGPGMTREENQREVRYVMWCVCVVSLLIVHVVWLRGENAARVRLSGY